MNTSVLFAFVIASLVVLITPGPGVVYVVTRSCAQGRRAGLVSVLGLSAGALFHVFAATVGLSAILLASAAAFSIVKFVGAAYLVYLGLRVLLDRSPAPSIGAPQSQSMRRIFNEGILVSVFNPKIAVFFLAYFPQFIESDAAPVQQQFLVLGLIYVSLALITDGMYALLADRFRRMFLGRFAFGRYLKLIPGAVYIGMGVSLVFAERKP